MQRSDLRENAGDLGNGEESHEEVRPSETANALPGIFLVLFVLFCFRKGVIA